MGEWWIRTAIGVAVGTDLGEDQIHAVEGVVESSLVARSVPSAFHSMMDTPVYGLADAGALLLSAFMVVGVGGQVG